MAAVTVSVPLTAEIENKLVLSWTPVQIGMAVGFMVLVIYLLCSFFYGYGSRNSTPQYVSPIAQIMPPATTVPAELSLFTVVQPTPKPSAAATPAPANATSTPASATTGLVAPAAGGGAITIPTAVSPNASAETPRSNINAEKCIKLPSGWIREWSDQC